MWARLDAGVFFRPTGAERLSINGAARHFQISRVTGSETSSRFWSTWKTCAGPIVKMAITLVAAMIICFAFRSTLVRVMQAPLHDLDPQVGALRALGITDSIVISFHRVFTPASFFPFRSFSIFGGICSARAHRGGKRFFASAILSASHYFYLACWFAILVAA
jgi:hypothetical protein